MSTLQKDILTHSKWLVKAFNELGIKLDYSVESIREIEKILNQEFENEKPKIGGLFENGLGGKIFAISSYLGEVIIKNTKATKWITDDKDPKGELNIKLLSANQAQMSPGQRVLKRIQFGESENLYHYTLKALEVMKFTGEIPDSFIKTNKPWWKFW